MTAGSLLFVRYFLDVISLNRVCYNECVMEWVCSRAFRSVTILVVIAIACVQGCGKRTSPMRNSKLIVAAGIAPLAYFTQRIGGGLVDVELLVPPSANPHTYQPNPRQMKKLAKASILVLNGLGVEFWASNAVETAQNPNLITVYTSEGLPLIGADKSGSNANPHVWLDPLNAMHQVRLIEKALAKVDPSHANVYRRNAARLIYKLRELDSEIKESLKHLKSRAFVSSHPAWTYFAKRYGLVEAAVIEKSPGQEPSPAEIRQIIDIIRRRGVKVIFVEPRSTFKKAETIAEETGAKLIVLDPLGSPPGYDYFKTMRKNLTVMSEAMR